MSCGEISNLMMKYFDGDISDLELQRLFKHNESCRDCAIAFDALKDALLAVEELPEIEIPEGFEAKIMTRIKTQTNDSQNYTIHPKVLLFWIMGAVGLMVFALNLLFFIGIPFLKESGLVTTLSSTMAQGFEYAAEILNRIIIEFAIGISYIVQFRDRLLQNYTVLIATAASGLILIQLLISRLREFEENQSS